MGLICAQHRRGTELICSQGEQHTAQQEQICGFLTILTALCRSANIAMESPALSEF
jgi:uncharacterized membrane protein YjdF